MGKKKDSSPNDELERLLASHEERYSTWHRYNELGGSDPTWPLYAPGRGPSRLEVRRPARADRAVSAPKHFNLT